MWTFTYDNRKINLRIADAFDSSIKVDTSVFGGTQDEEFAEPSRKFFERVRNSEFIILLSSFTVDELIPAPKQVMRILLELPARCVERFYSNPEIEALAEAYIEADILTNSSRMDALHVAAASVAGADLIISWNFKHIVCYDRIRKFNAVNVLKGYRSLDILSPLEMCHENEDKDI